MMLRILLGCGWLCCLMAPSAVLAQGEWTNKAILLGQENRLDEALYAIESAMDSPERNDPLTWYVKAFLHKSLYVENDGRHPDSEQRELAVEAAMESMRLDATRSLSERWEPLLEFLADSHLEDARDAIPRSTPDHAREAEGHFDAHASIRKAIEPGWDEAPDRVLLYQQLAEFAFLQAESEEQKGAGPWFARGAKCYELATNMGPDAWRSTYNRAVHTYNQGVRQFKAAEDDLDAVDQSLKDAAVLWRQAAQLFEDAIGLNDKNPSSFEALAVVSEALLNQQKVDWCKSHLSELRSR